jgi:hypothetical protein
MKQIFITFFHVPPAAAMSHQWLAATRPALEK